MIWRRRQDGVHSGQQRDRRYRARISALGRDDHHGIAFLQVRQLAIGQAAQQALKVRRTIPARPTPAARRRQPADRPAQGRWPLCCSPFPPPAAPPAFFSRMAMRCAISAGSFFICESADTFTTTALFPIASCTVIVLFAVSIALMIPAIFRNVPETTSSALTSLPSGLRVPRARN